MEASNKAITLLGLVVALVFGCIYVQPDVGPALAFADARLDGVVRLLKPAGQQQEIVVIIPNGDEEEEQVRVSAPVSTAPAGWRQAWSVDLLDRLGNRQPTQATLNLVVAWTLAEDSREGAGTAWARNNPLNTTQGGFDEVEVINSDGVKGYVDYESGIAATIQTLSYGYYTEIVAGLQANDPERALRGIYNSPWGTDARNIESLWRGM